MDVETRDDYYHEVSKKIVIIIEQLLAVLSRQFIFGKRSKIGMGVCISNFGHFDGLYEGDYGKKDYTKKEIRFEDTLEPHKRTWRDSINSAINPFYKTKTIKRDSFPQDWPFKADKVVIESRDKRWYIVIIDGYEYALNGKTSSHFKIPTPIKGGKIDGIKSSDAFLKMAKEL